ncbi:MAG: hypothetical protein RR382_00670 [Tannerellaceae bacterium]
MAYKALFPVPGLFEKDESRMGARIITHEDGSLDLVVFAGSPSDVVNYSMFIPGENTGYVKDPEYAFPVEEKLSNKGEYPQYKFEEDIIPGISKRITLRAAPFTLPIGTTVIQVIINGKITEYFLTRPASIIHGKPDVSIDTYRPPATI